MPGTLCCILVGRWLVGVATTPAATGTPGVGVAVTLLILGVGVAETLFTLGLGDWNS